MVYLPESVVFDWIHGRDCTLYILHSGCALQSPIVVRVSAPGTVTIDPSILVRYILHTSLYSNVHAPHLFPSPLPLGFPLYCESSAWQPFLQAGSTFPIIRVQWKGSEAGKEVLVPARAPSSASVWTLQALIAYHRIRRMVHTWHMVCTQPCRNSTQTWRRLFSNSNQELGWQTISTP